jgi:hypothetical protein
MKEHDKKTHRALISVVESAYKDTAPPILYAELLINLQFVALIGHRV